MGLADLFLRVEDVGVTALAVIPLPVVESDLPPTDYPTLTDLLSMDWAYGPGREVPGLYILRKQTQQPDVDVEEYRIGLLSPPRDITAYYRAWRTLDERRRYPLEWSRAFYIGSD